MEKNFIVLKINQNNYNTIKKEKVLKKICETHLIYVSTADCSNFNFEFGFNKK